MTNTGEVTHAPGALSETIGAPVSSTIEAEIAITCPTASRYWAVTVLVPSPEGSSVATVEAYGVHAEYPLPASNLISRAVRSVTVESTVIARVVVQEAPPDSVIDPLGGVVSRVVPRTKETVVPVPLRYSIRTVFAPSPAGMEVVTVDVYANQPPNEPVPGSTRMETALVIVDSMVAVRVDT